MKSQDENIRVMAHTLNQCIDYVIYTSGIDKTITEENAAKIIQELQNMDPWDLTIWIGKVQPYFNRYLMVREQVCFLCQESIIQTSNGKVWFLRCGKHVMHTPCRNAWVYRELCTYCISRSPEQYCHICKQNVVKRQKCEICRQ